MRAILVLGPLGLLLAACAAPVPSDQGVGFGDYNAYQAQRDAQLTGAPMGGFSASAMPTTPRTKSSPPVAAHRSPRVRTRRLDVTAR